MTTEEKKEAVAAKSAELNAMREKAAVVKDELNALKEIVPEDPKQEEDDA